MENNHIPDGNDPNFPVRIYTDGIFDCFHFGHARLLQQIKNMFKHVYLIVGVCSDSDTIREKGIPIMTMEERAECIRHCKWADEVYENAPWFPSVQFLDQIKCHYIAHDPEPYPADGIDDVYSDIKDHKRFIATTRTEGISTTDIIARVLKHYEGYIDRSIKKGARPEELSITPTKWFAIKISQLIKKFKINEKQRTQILKKFFDKLNDK
jgi:choline-phosphate cytidylyltransferase